MLATLLSTQDGDRLCTGVPPSCNQQGTHCSPTSTTQGGIDQETVRTKQTSTLWPRFFSPPPTSPNNIKVPALPKPTQKSLNKPQPSPWAIPSFPDRHPQSEGWGGRGGVGGLGEVLAELLPPPVVQARWRAAETVVKVRAQAYQNGL